jgi:hypothetical protein
MTVRLQRIAALALVAAGVGTLGAASGGLAQTDRQLSAAVKAPTETRLVDDRDCPRTPTPTPGTTRPEL